MAPFAIPYEGRSQTDLAPAEAFEALYRRCSPYVFKFAVRRVGVEQAKDIVSETFEVVWRKWTQLPDEHDGQIAWIVGISRNKIRQDIARRTSRTWAELHEFDAREVVNVMSGPHDVADTVIATLHGREVYSQLTAQQQELLDIAHLQALTPRQAAQVLGISVTAYTTRVSRLRARIETLAQTHALRWDS